MAKLSSFVDFCDAEREELEALTRSAKWYRQGTTLIHDGDRPENVFLLMDGWACREKTIDSGARQIVAYLIPGDLCDPHVFILAKMDHAISLLSDARVVSIPKQTIINLTDRRPRIARALWWATLVDEAVLRHWLVNIGQRDAFDSVAHLFCELWERMNQVGLTRGGSFSLPLTQEQLADTMGMTSVHVNRVLQRMRAAGLITMESKTLTIHDVARLRELGDFDPGYLHLNRRVQH
jgi:CRP-like cAMP-binding protein